MRHFHGHNSKIFSPNRTTTGGGLPVFSAPSPAALSLKLPFQLLRTWPLTSKIWLWFCKFCIITSMSIIFILTSFFAPFFLKLFPVDFCIASSMTSYTRKSPQSVASFRSRSSTPKRTQKNKREN